jgi:hypothetical protein
VEYNFSKTLARIGGALIIVGLILPWYKFDLGQLAEAFGGSGASFKAVGLPTGQTFTAWDSARTVFFVVGFFGVLALTQVPFSTPGIVGRFFMFAGFAGFILLGYKIVHPPLDFLELLKMKLKPQPGIFLALAGMAFTAYAGWEQVKQDLSKPRYNPAAPPSDWQMAEDPGQAFGHHEAMQPGQAQVQTTATPRAIPPDPFAPKPPTFSQ